tara:strand:+ start:1008 stop:1793 length:786 start_codon:yes stop_codon:yes gene_type:complete
MFVLVKHISSNELCFVIRIKKQLHSHCVQTATEFKEILVTHGDFDRYYTYQSLYISQFPDVSCRTLVAGDVPFIQNNLFAKLTPPDIVIPPVSSTETLVVKIKECSMNFSSFMYVLSSFLSEIMVYCNTRNIPSARNKCIIIWNQIYSRSFRQNIDSVIASLKCLFSENQYIQKQGIKFLEKLELNMSFKYRSNDTQLISNFCYVNDIVSQLKCQCVFYIDGIINSESLMDVNAASEICVITEIRKINEREIEVSYAKTNT